MNIAIILATLVVIIGLMAATNLQQPYKRRIRNLFIIALVITLGGCFGLVKNLDSITSGRDPDMWSNSLMWVILFFLGVVVSAIASAIALYLNAKQEK